LAPGYNDGNGCWRDALYPPAAVTRKLKALVLKGVPQGRGGGPYAASVGCVRQPGRVLRLDSAPRSIA